ncbi:hypothetical protein [Nocardia sp. AB354]|uniref:hypothetical protein n=1 Tax=Nocardia sp. AB354 TaxID=3413283 RepID=UPI003C193A5A
MGLIGEAEKREIKVVASAPLGRRDLPVNAPLIAAALGVEAVHSNAIAETAVLDGILSISDPAASRPGSLMA